MYTELIISVNAHIGGDRLIQPIGYFKMWRELFNKPIWLDSTPEQKVILVTLLAMANFDTKEWEWQGKPYKADRGQFVTSLPSIVKNCGQGVTLQNVRTALKRFETYGFLTDQSTNKNRLITIVNWTLYQQNENELTGNLTGNQQAANRQLTAREEGKEVKKVKKDIYMPEFEKFYSIYPNPQNKQRSFNNWKKQLKEYTIEQLTQATLNYKKLVEKEKRERQYIKSSANFLGQDKFFKDYLGGESDGTNEQSDGKNTKTYNFDKTKFLTPGTF
jgi:hypothetical protein